MRIKKARMNCKGQVSLYVVLALVVVAAIVLFFMFRGNLFVDSIPAEFQPVYSLYGECIAEEAEIGLDLLGTQGGLINTGVYEAGSDYAPYGSHLNFLGSSVRYWYSVSPNGLIEENAPTKTEMERELGEFVASRVNENCDFDRFYEQGFYIDYEDPEVNVEIGDNSVRVSVNSDLAVSRGESSALKSEHEVSVDSKIGSFYDQARGIYESQLTDEFLEEYAVDFLRLYAPVDGVEVQCSPVTWETQEVVNNLQEGLENNFQKVKFEGDYYTLNEQEDEYFVTDVGVSDSARVLYSGDWPSKIEVTPANEAFMIAEPIGNQQGLGAMGFCYVPYHFVWDLGFPVMIQVYDGSELFQFPVVVIIDNNVPKDAELVSPLDYSEPEFSVCDFREGNVQVNTFDNNLNPVEAQIEFGCVNEVCDLGSTEISGTSASLNADIPQCVNGYLIADAEGFAEERKQFSSNSDGVVDVILDREYELDVNVLVNGRSLGDGEIALVHFKPENGAISSAILPESSEVVLQEGSYEISVFVYGGSALSIPASTREECQEIPRGGIAGLFGATREQCFDIEIPATEVEQALIAGGHKNTYILESQLDGGSVVIDASSFPRVNSLEQLQYNYALSETQDFGVRFI